MADAEAAGISRQAIVEAIRKNFLELQIHYDVALEASELLDAIGAPVQFDVLRLDEAPISNEAMRRQTAIEDGYYAFNLEQAISANPFGTNQQYLRNAWRKGWNMAAAGQDLK